MEGINTTRGLEFVYYPLHQVFVVSGSWNTEMYQYTTVQCCVVLFTQAQRGPA